MAVNVKLGVDLGSFNSNISTAKTQIRSFDAELKLAESSFKATGDAEAAMTAKTQALNGKLQTQQKMVQQYSKALQQMKDAGIEPTSKAYVQMQTQMLNAQAGMMETQAALNGLDGSQKQAASSADQLAKSVNGIGKKISLEQVISGIDRVTSGLENAARKAVQLGEQIFNTIMESAQRAGDQAKMAQMYEIPLERYKQMIGLEAAGLKTSTDAILGAQSKLAKGIGGGNKNAIEALRDLGVSMKTLEDTGDGILEFVDKDPEETFFEIGRALMEMSKAYDKEAAAQALFGRSWRELIPLFTEYKTLEEYEKALSEVSTTSDETTNNLDEMADRVGKLENTWTTLKDEVVGAVAPALTEGANALNGMLESILEYLRTPEGKQMLTDLGNAVSGLFEDLGKIDPEQTVQSFTKVFTDITGGVQWIADHHREVVSGLEAIAIGWGALKLTGGALDILKLVQGLQGLGGGGGLGGAAGQVMLNLGGKLAFNGIESTLGTSIGSVIANSLTSTPMTVMIAAASIAALGHAIYTVINEKDPLKTFLTENGISEEAADAFIQAGKETYNPFDTNANARVTRGIKSFLTTGKWESEPVEIPTELEVPANAEQNIEEQIGAVTVPVNLRVNMGGGHAGGGGIQDYFLDTLFGSFRPGYANGIPYVPDTRLAWLHPGERVLTAAANRSYTYNNNTYFGNVNLNNGTQVEHLADAIARNNRKVSRGYGS